MDQIIMPMTEQATLYAAEAILFAAGEPLDTKQIALALGTDRRQTILILRQLGDSYAFQQRGIRLLHLDDSWQLCSAPEYSENVRKALEIRKPSKLSTPALEVLTIVAYYQPVTRLYIEEIRGTDSSYILGLLLNRQLIETCGHLQAPGRPRLYRTTPQFLRTFHLNSLNDLPELPDSFTDMLEPPSDDATEV